MNPKESTGSTGAPPEAGEFLPLGQFRACGTQARRPQSAMAQRLFLITVVLCLVWDWSARSLRESSSEETHEKDWTVTVPMSSRDKASIQFLLQRPQSWEVARAFGSLISKGAHQRSTETKEACPGGVCTELRVTLKSGECGPPRCGQAAAARPLMPTQGDIGVPVLQDAVLMAKGRLKAHGSSRITLMQNKHCQCFLQAHVHVQMQREVWKDKN